MGVKMRLSISEILKKTTELNTYPEKIEYLRRNDSPALRKMLEFAYDRRIEWDIPTGKPPYTPCPYLDQEGMLYNEMKRMYLFLKGGNPSLTAMKREGLFIQLLQSLNHNDAELLLAVKDHTMPYDIPESLVRDAFPDCLQFPPAQIKVMKTPTSLIIETPADSVIDLPKEEKLKKPRIKKPKKEKIEN